MNTFISRRKFTTTSVAAMAASLSLPPASVCAEPETLAQAGHMAGLDIGSAIRTDPNPDVASLIARECSLVTPENAMKPGNISPSQGVFRWAAVDETYTYAKANGLKVHGHTLFWHKQPLAWAVQAGQGKGLDDLVDIYGAYVVSVVRHFAETVSWDVFNEVVGAGQMLRDTFPLATSGVDFIERLLNRVREAAPRARLVINENDLEGGDKKSGAKRENALKLLHELRRRDAPLDAFGIQGHLSSRNRPSADQTLAFVDELESLGLDVYLSEMDVNDAELADDILQRDEEVADMYRGFLETVLKSRAVKRVVFWGMTDAANWLADGAAGRRADGSGHRPALFDRFLVKKPAYYAVMAALRSAPKR